MNFLKNLKFVRKIQAGFLIIAAIATTILAINFYQIQKLSDAKEAIFVDYVAPQEKIYNIYADFQKVQSLMMQFSMEAFASQFNAKFAEYETLKANIDKTIDEILEGQLGDEVRANLLEIKGFWGKYKEEAGDAILSAAITQNFEMAADIAVTSGEEFSAQMINRFNIAKNGLTTKASNLKDSIALVISETVLLILIGAGLGSTIFLLCTLILAPAITKPINYLKGIVKEFSLGNYDLEIKTGTKDEIGELARHITILQKAQKEKILAAQNIADGKLEKVSPASDKDLLALAFNREVDSIELLLSEFNILVKANNAGDLDVRGKANNFSGGWREIIEGANSIIESFITPINEAAEVLDVLAKGDLSRRMTGDYNGAYKKIKANINQVGQSLSTALTEVVVNITSTTDAANQIFISSEEMAAGAQEQSAQTAEVAAAVEEMATTLIETMRNAGAAAENARKAGTIAEEGGRVVERTVEGMQKIAEVVISSAETVKKLGRSSDQIGEIIQVIDDIADQTNLLALNAAIEAARAGEQGRGFAVVADEVRKLAERTTKATREIADMIKQIQKETGDAVGSMEKGTEEVSKGKELAGKAGESLREIIKASEKVVNDVTRVADASQEQSATAEQISKNVEAISTVTQQSAAGIQQVAKAAGDLNGLTDNLQKMISKFKIDSSAKDEHFSVRQNGKLIQS